MTTPDIEPILDRWLGEGTDILPDRSVEAVLRTVDRTSQRTAWRLPWRMPNLNADYRPAAMAGAAAMVVFVVGGLLWLGGPSDPSAGGPSPSAGSTWAAGLMPELLVGRTWIAERGPDGVSKGLYELYLGQSAAYAGGLDGTPPRTMLGNVGGVEGNVIELRPTSTCEGSASYLWALGEGGSLDLQPITDDCPARRSLLAGSWEAQAYRSRHTLTVGGVPFSLGVPTAGWEPNPGLPNGVVSLNKSFVGPQGAEAMIYWASYPGDYADPCADLLTLPGRASAAELAAAVARAPGTELVTGPVDVTVGGRPAKHVVVVVREDLGCDPGHFFAWEAESGGAHWMTTDVGDTVRVWIIDVDETPIFIAAETKKLFGPGPLLEQEIQQIIESIRFE